MPSSLTCYGGAGEIGGNKILLENRDVRLWLDFGTPFGRHKQYFNEYLSPRSTRGLWDLIALGLLPPLRGLYRQDLEIPGLWDRFAHHDVRRSHAPAADGVLLTHAHLDHMGDLAFLAPDIPIVATPESAAIGRAMQVSGRLGLLQEWCYVTEREWDASSEVLQPARSSPYRARPFRLLAEEELPDLQAWWQEPWTRRRGLDGDPPSPFPGRVKTLDIHRWPVDHSIPGAAAFAVETDGGWVAYTGDFRFHGGQKEAGQRLQDAWARMEIAVLICEGTRLGDAAPGVDEAMVYDNALGLIREAAGRPAVVDFATRNLERLQTFLAIADETGRLLVAQPRDIYLLEAAAKVSPAFARTVAHPCLALYRDVKSRPRSWEQDVRERWQDRTVGSREISQDPGAYILCCSLWDMNDLLDLKPESLWGGVYLYANSRAYDEEQAVDLERLRAWIRHLGLRMEGDPDDPHAVPLHASGHAGEEDLAAFVRAVRPRRLLAVHTEQPGRWRDLLAGTTISLLLPDGAEGERFFV